MNYPAIGITVLRIVVGIVFAAHGWQKLGGGVEGTAGFFGSLGIPLPQVAAVVVIALELLGGIALILGLGTRYVAALLAFNMLVAMLLVHLSNGFFAGDGGVEFVLTLMAACVTLALTGAGAYALDDLVFRRGQSPAVARS
ncbi:MAG TPA: DoxX family protein [Roseiflexaceae bacterium]|nr:DoxX family protein [Roseiflexaceae bacterium]